MYNTVMVPIDLAYAEQGQALIETARKLGGERARIILVNVIADIPVLVAVELPGGVIDKSKQKAREALEEMARGASGNTEVEVRSGTVHQAILAAAQEKGADLIVVGSHRPGLSDFLLGSTAARVVRHAKCSVMVLR